MKLLARLFNLERKTKRKTLGEYEQEAIAEYAKVQFQKLQERGLQIPIALL